MVTYQDLQAFFKRRDFNLIMAADAETRILSRSKGKVISQIPPGGVAVALDPIARASNAIYIGRGKTEEEREILAGENKSIIEHVDGNYTLKRLFFDQQTFHAYYNGFSNQTLWPLCHVAFEHPQFDNNWYEGYRKVNETFAKAIREEIKGKTFVWLQDYQLALVPKLLGRPKDTIIAMFWHIPWPTWEVFRILPQKKEILESLLMNDFLAFHRGYQVRNFLETVRRELEVRIDEETNKVYFNNHATTVRNLPLGIDTDVIKSMIIPEKEGSFFSQMVKDIMGGIVQTQTTEKPTAYDEFFQNNKVILGVDRLDYTKGLRLRLMAIDAFLEKNPKYQGNVVYFGILSPSRGAIPAYKELKKDVKGLASVINKKYATKTWHPINLIHSVFAREEIINFYKKANLCLVTPLDDGMNLVSKEFVVASSSALNPGMLVLSQFAGSAIDLTRALIVNPYNIEEVAAAIKRGLEMSKEEKKARIQEMTETLDEKNVYEWTEEFIRNATAATR